MKILEDTGSNQSCKRVTHLVTRVIHSLPFLEVVTQVPVIFELLCYLNMENELESFPVLKT